MTRRVSPLTGFVAVLTLALAVLLTPGPIQGADGTAAAAAAGAAPGPATAEPGRPTVLAHYYIWFDRSSWSRAKVDLPLAGRYSSDDADVVRRQVREAKAAGISGFMVSWKSTPTLDARLRTLVRISEEESFGLALTYQGLTFDRVNLPPARVGADLDTFIADFAGSPAFDLFDRPLVALTGTPGLTVDQVRSITAPRRDRLLILATDKNVASYERIAAEVDGLLYYWSSVNPQTNPGYATKLAAMGAAVRGHGGLWVAPVAPGFDARLVGGSSQVPRRDGATLRAQWDAAMASMPDAIGIISWNEFSENTQIEPSQKYGADYLRIVTSLIAARAPAAPGDSDSPGGQGAPWRAVGVGATLVLLLAGATWLGARRRRGRAR